MTDVPPHDDKIWLNVPTDGDARSVVVSINVNPTNADYVISGKIDDGSFHDVKLHGPHAEVTLPFVHPRLYVKFLSDNIRAIEIRLLRWDSRSVL